MTRLLFLLLLSCTTLFAQRTPLKVNGNVVNNPNLTNTSSLTWSVIGGNVSGSAVWGGGDLEADNITATTILSTNKLTIGSGDNLWWNDDNTAQSLDLRKGTSANPDTTSDPLAKFSRVIELDEAQAAGDGGELGAALEAIVTTGPTNGIMPVAVYAVAYSNSTNAPYGRDATGLYSIGASYGGGVGIGSFMVGYSDAATNLFSALQLSAVNASGANSSYSATGFSDKNANWIYASGGSDSGAGIIFGNPDGDQFDVGIGIPAHLTEGKTGGIKTTTLRDDGNAVTSIDIRGSRTTGINLANGTFSGFALDANGKAVRLGNVNQSAVTFGDGLSATFTETFSLSGATDPVITAANNSLSVNVPLTLGDGSAATYVLGSSLSGATDPTLTFGNSLITSSSAFTLSGGNLTIQNGDQFKWLSRGSISATADGAFLFRNNASANGGITAGTLTLTPAAADTTALTVSGGSTTGSGTTSAATLAWTWNTSGVIDGGLRLAFTDTASGSGSKPFAIYGGAAASTALFNVDKGGQVTAAAGITIGAGDVFRFTGRGAYQATANGAHRFTDSAGTSGANLTYGLKANFAVAGTIASAATIAPTAPVTFISGTTTIDTITAPTPISSTGGQITLIPTGVWATSTSGNIALITTAVVSKALIMTYDQATAKWYPSY